MKTKQTSVNPEEQCTNEELRRYGGYGIRWYEFDEYGTRIIRQRFFLTEDERESFAARLDGFSWCDEEPA